jgi:hypothetical protein
MVGHTPDRMKIKVRQGFNRSRRSLVFLQSDVEVNMVFVQNRTDCSWVDTGLDESLVADSPEKRGCGERGESRRSELDSKTRSKGSLWA